MNSSWFRCQTDTGRSRLEQHHSKSAALKSFRKKKRAIKAGSDKTRTVSDSRPQTRRNLSDVPSKQNRSHSTKRSTYKSDIKNNKQLPNQIRPFTPEQRDPVTIESDSLNTDNESCEKRKMSPVSEEATSSVFSKSEIYDVITAETTSNITTRLENVVEDNNYVGYEKKCINEHEYSQFLLRITEDIIRNECYTMEMILNVFKSHIEANKSHLDLDKMLLMIKKLCSEINFPLEIKEIEDCDENEQCRICVDYSCENMNLNCTAAKLEQQQETILDKCETNDAFPQNQEEVNVVKEMNSLCISTDDGQTKSPIHLLSEKLRRCLEKDGETSPKMKNEPEEIKQSLKHKIEEKGEEKIIMSYNMNKEKLECEPEQKWNKEENALPVHYVNQQPVKNEIESKEVTFCNFSSEYSSDIDCNEYADEAVEVIKLPPKAFVDESCFDKNFIHVCSSNNTTTTCDLPLDTNKMQCKGTEIQTEIVNETKTTVIEKNQPVQQRAVGIQWGKCSCLNNKGNQTANCYVPRECSTSKIVPKSTDASTQYAKSGRGCPSSSEYYKKKRSAKEFPEKVDAFVQYDKDNCGADFENEPQKDVKEYIEANFNGCKKNSENGTAADKGYYKINEYKSMLQNLFQKCDVITKNEAPLGKLHQATNALPKLLLENYKIKACQKSSVPIKLHCPLKPTKEDEIFISPVYENWSVCSKDVKFDHEVAHQHPQIQQDFHATVMHDAFTSMPNKQLFTTPYCSSANRICDKREIYLLDSTYEKNNYKENTVLPLTLAAFFPNAETQTTDIDRHLATRLIMSIQAPTKEEVPNKGNSDIPQNVTESTAQNIVEEISQIEKEVQNKTIEESATTQKKGSLKAETKNRIKSIVQANKMVSVGNTEEVPFTFENDITRYHSEPLPVENVTEKEIPENSQGGNTFDEDLQEDNGGSEEIEIENIEEEEDVNEPDSLELMELRSRGSRKSSGGSRNKQIEQTEKQDEPLLSDESEYNCCGRKKIYVSEMASQNNRSSTKGNAWIPDKQTLLNDEKASYKSAEMQQMTHDIDKQSLKKGNKRLADKNIDIESIKKRFDRTNSSVASDETRIEQTIRKTLGDKPGKDRGRTKSHYLDEENLEVIRTRSKKRNTLMLLQDQVSNDS